LQPTFDTEYANDLASHPDGAAEEGGKAVGEEVAAYIMSLRRGDGRNAVVPYVQPPVGPGVFEPTVPGSTPFGTHVGRIRPLTIPSPSAFRPGPPPALASDQYARDFNEVKTRGRRPEASRGRSETYIALFWNDHGVAMWNRALLRLVTDRGLGVAPSARLLAMAHAAGGDGMIGCFDAKYTYYFWRPLHAIPRAGTDGNPQTEPDPAWEPLIHTPNHPEYPAAHSCHSTAVATAATIFFGTDNITLTIDSAQTGETRIYARASDAINQVIDARILSGVHFRFSGQAGTTLGSQVANYAATRFEPV
jgi:hypothetical protein